MRMPLEGAVLTMKALGIQCVSSFPFPSPPAPTALFSALRTLTNLGAIVPVLKKGVATLPAATGTQAKTLDASAREQLDNIDSETITPLGRRLARLPLHPALAKMLVLAWRQQEQAASKASGAEDPASRLVDYTIALVAGMTVQEPFVRPSLSGVRKPKQSKKLEDEGKAKGGASKNGAEGSDDEEDEPNASDDEEDLDAAGDAIDRRLAAEFGDLDESDAAAERRRVELELERQQQEATRNAAAAAHARFRHPQSDALTVLRAAGAHGYTLATGGAKGASAFCKSMFLRAKGMQEIQQLRQQLHSIVYGELGVSSAEGAGAKRQRADGEGGDHDGKEDALADGSGDFAEAVTAASDAEDADADVADAAPADKKAGGKKNKGARTAEPKVRPFALALPPPSAATEALLLQVLAAGQLEKVAKKATSDVVSRIVGADNLGVAFGSKARPLVPYLASSATQEELLYIHQYSAVFDGDASLMPQYVVYTEVVKNKVRSNMKGVSAIHGEWLHTLAAGTPLCRYDDPLESPAPKYEGPPADRVVATCVPLFGDRQWRMPPAKVPYPAGGDASRVAMRLRCFVRAFLEGGVAAPLVRFTEHVNPSPAFITKKAYHHKRVELFVHVLRNPPAEFGQKRDGEAPEPISSAAALARVWMKYPAYLRTEFKAWLPVEYHKDVDAVWSQVVALSLEQWKAGGLRWSA